MPDSLLGWGSAKTVEKIHSFFEYAETVSLAVAIFLEISGMRLSSNVAWVVLVISDVGRNVYSRREKHLSDAESKKDKERLNQLSQGRGQKFTKELQESLIDLLKPFAGNNVDVFLFDEHSIEALLVADRLRSTFGRAGWKQALWHCTSGRTASGSLSIALARDLFVEQGPISPLQRVMIEVASRVHTAGIEITQLASGFDRTYQFQPWEMKESAHWDPSTAAPLRIEVSAQQFVPFIDQIG